MKFPNSETDIPEELLFAHQKGEVVFLCGAGISMDAGLPSFKDLVRGSAARANLALTEEDCALFKQGMCDAVYQNLEQRIGADKRFVLRKATADILAHWAKKRKKITGEWEDRFPYHSSLLKLALTNDERLHLVTTNYDDLFCKAENSLRSKGELVKVINHYAAPTLPLPKSASWDGIVYLHGKLDGSCSRDNLNSLVLSSGDFGEAYLTEGWALRFVMGLFRNFTVCFIGYSLNDVIMRYIINALVTSGLRGEAPRSIYAFAGNEKGKEAVVESKWREIGVKPILFQQKDKYDYSELKLTVKAWCDYHAKGVKGPVEIIRQEACIPPSSPFDKNDSIKRVLWALKTADKLGAKVFCNIEPPAPLEWFDVFLAETLKDRERYHAEANAGKGSIPPRELIPLSSEAKLDSFSESILEWLAKYLDKPMLLAKLSSVSSERSHPLSSAIIDFFLEKLSNIKLKVCMDSRLRKLWLLWLESEKQPRLGLYEVNPDAQMSIMMEYGSRSGGEKMLANILEPRLVVFPRKYCPKKVSTEELGMHDLVCWDYKVAVSTVVGCRNQSREYALDALPSSLAYPIEAALNNLCRMKQELGEEKEIIYSNSSEWSALVILMWHVWRNLKKDQPDEALRLVKKWSSSHYSVMKRLAWFVETDDVSQWSDPHLKSVRLDSTSDMNTLREKTPEEIFKAKAEEMSDADLIDYARKIFQESQEREDVGLYCEKVMEIVLRRWYSDGKEKGDGVESPFREFFEFVAAGEHNATRSARRILFANLCNFLLIDEDWACTHLLPLFSWNNATALDAWKDALYLAKIDEDLMLRLKKDFIETAGHKLGDSGKWYVRIVVHMALAHFKGYGAATYTKIIRNLSDKGRIEIAGELCNKIDYAKDGANDCPSKAVVSFIKMWPAEEKCVNAKIAEMLLASIARRDEFLPDAANAVLKMYGGKIPLQDVSHLLAAGAAKRESICRKFPNEALEILSRGDFSDQDRFTASRVKECLGEIKDSPYRSSKDSFEKDIRFRKLTDYVERILI